MRRLPGIPEGEPVPTGAARVAVVASALAGVLALVAGGLLAGAAALASAVAVAIAATVPVLWPTPGGILGRRLVSSVVLLVTLLLTLWSLGTVDTDPVALAHRLSSTLTALLVMVLVAQLAVLDRWRDARVALVLTSGMFVLGLASTPTRLVVVALVVGWPALVAALALRHDAQQEATSDVVARVAGAGRPQTGLPRAGWLAAVAGAIAVLLVLVLPHPDGLQRRSGWQGAGPVSGGGPADDARPRSTLAYTSGYLDMRSRGELSDTPVAQVPAGSPRLWRGAALDLYDGTGWRALPDRMTGAAVPGGPRYELPATDPGPTAGAVRTDTVVPLAGWTGVLIAPGRATSVVSDGSLLRLAGGYLLGPSADRRAAPYDVTSQSTVHDAGELIGASVLATAPSPVPLQLPASLPDRVRRLGLRLTGGAPDRYAAMEAVRGYVHDAATYTLDSPVPAPGEDAVDNFLFTSHRGFCEQFAAAEVVLLRAGGIPARLATGFAADGTAAGASAGAASTDRVTIRASAAHAWAEVWFPGVGWVASDPTPSAGPDAPGLRDRLRSWFSDRTHVLGLLGGVLVLLLLSGATWWWLRRRARFRRAALAPSRLQPPPVLAAFVRLERALAETGAPRGTAESVSELAARSSLAGTRSALAVVERTSYSAHPPDGAAADEAVRALDALGERLREAARAP